MRGRNVSGSSAYRRTSIAWPLGVGAAGTWPPSAMRIISAIRSTPVTSSVTGCSTWMRAFSSRNQISSPVTRNSAVPAPQ